MSVPILTFFNNKGGVGKTSLVYHLAYMFAKLGKQVVVGDFDPQANLTAAFLDEDRIEDLWTNPSEGTTIFKCIEPLTGFGDIAEPVLQKIAPNLDLLPGDVRLSGYETVLSEQWPASLGDAHLYRPMRILTAFWQVMQQAAKQVDATIILIDVGPHLGAINRSALIATDYVIMPLGADLFSLQGLKNLGPTLKTWKSQWEKRLKNWTESPDSKTHQGFEYPQGRMNTIGYLCQQHSVRLSRPIKAYDKWINRIPKTYRDSLGLSPLPDECASMHPKEDPFCLATIKHYRSLIPMGQEHHKPIFDLTPADGAIGSHASAAQGARQDFETLAKKIASKIDLAL